MSHDEIVSGLAKLASPIPITRENVDDLLDRRMLEVHIRNGNWWEMRRNGATKRWKRDPRRIYIPFKYGFEFYGNLTEADFGIPNGENSFPQSKLDGTGKLNSLYFRIKPSPELRK